MFWFVGGTLKGNVAWLYDVDVVPCGTRGDACVIASGISRDSHGINESPLLVYLFRLRYLYVLFYHVIENSSFGCFESDKMDAFQA